MSEEATSSRHNELARRIAVIDRLLDALAAAPSWTEDREYQYLYDHVDGPFGFGPGRIISLRQQGCHDAADEAEATLRRLDSLIDERRAAVEACRHDLLSCATAEFEWLRVQDQMLDGPTASLPKCGDGSTCTVREVDSVGHRIELQWMLRCGTLCSRCRESTAVRLRAIQERVRSELPIPAEAPAASVGTQQVIAIDELARSYGLKPKSEAEQLLDAMLDPEVVGRWHSLTTLWGPAPADSVRRAAKLLVKRGLIESETVGRAVRFRAPGPSIMGVDVVRRGAG